jgi:hypothetical protein
LKKSGPDGAAVLDLAGGSTPPAAKHTAAKDSSKGPRLTTQKVASMSGPSSDPLKAVASSVGGGSTLSGLLVPTLLVVGVGGLGLVWRRTGTH